MCSYNKNAWYFGHKSFFIVLCCTDMSRLFDLFIWYTLFVIMYNVWHLVSLREPFTLFPVVVRPFIPRCGWMVDELGTLRRFTHQVWKEFSHRWRCNLNTARLSFPFPNTCLMRNVCMRADFSTHICFPSMTDEVWRQARQKTGAAAAWKDSPLESFLCIQVSHACVL